MSVASALILPSAILFDMDGTLTRPMLDFPAIKADMGIGDRPILEAMAVMPPNELAKAEAILHRHEEEAALHSTLNAGCEALLQWIDSARLRTALITRNSRQSVTTVLAKHGLEFDVLIARDDAPPKPDPRPLWLACQRLHVEPAAAWMVGDGQYDIEAGRAAGVRTVWISHGKSRPFAAEPWRATDDLFALTAMLKSCTLTAKGSACL